MSIKNVTLKPLFAAVISPFISLPLAIPASRTLDGLLREQGLPGAHSGMFYGGIIGAVFLGLVGAITFGYVFGLQKNIFRRISLGVISGVVAGACYASVFTDRSYIQQLGVALFCGYGAIWGGVGGGIFALVVEPVYSKFGLTSRNDFLRQIPDKSLFVSSAVTVLAALIPFAFSTSASSQNNVHVVVGSEKNCNAADQQSKKYRSSLPVGVYAPRVVYTINGTYGVSIGKYSQRTGKKALVSAVKRGIIPRDSILVAESDILKDEVACK